MPKTMVDGGNRVLESGGGGIWWNTRVEAPWDWVHAPWDWVHAPPYHKAMGDMSAGSEPGFHLSLTLRGHQSPLILKPKNVNWKVSLSTCPKKEPA